MRAVRAASRAVGLLATIGLVSAGCSSRDAPPPRHAESAPERPTPAPAAAPALPGTPEVSRALPAGCSDASAPCYPPVEFVESLCRGKYPAVAILMFRKEQPWAHVYVKVNEVFPVNAFAGPVTHVPLLFSEEVVVLRHRPFVPRPGYDMKNPDNFDVLRTSGTCATVAEDQIRDHWAGPSLYAPLVWSWLEPGFRQVLAASDRVVEARRRQEQTCAGRYIGGGTADCQRASVGLVQAILSEVNEGLTLPEPLSLPEWTPPRR
jgi:hypothetical protein